MVVAQLVRDILVEPAPPASVLSATARLAGVGLHNCVVRSGAAKCSCVALAIRAELSVAVVGTLAVKKSAVERASERGA